MLEMEKTKAGDQDFDKVLKYTRKRLDQNMMNESSMQATNENWRHLDYRKKQNFLLNQHSRLTHSDTVDMTGGLQGGTQKYPAGLLLRETSQERALARMDELQQEWTNQEVQREQRFKNERIGFEPDKKPRTEVLDGLPGTHEPRAVTVMRSTGKFFGTRQSKSIITYGERHNQLMLAREACSR